MPLLGFNLNKVTYLFVAPFKMDQIPWQL